MPSDHEPTVLPRHRARLATVGHTAKVFLVCFLGDASSRLERVASSLVHLAELQGQSCGWMLIAAPLLRGSVGLGESGSVFRVVRAPQHPCGECP